MAARYALIAIGITLIGFFSTRSLLADNHVNCRDETCFGEFEVFSKSPLSFPISELNDFLGKQCSIAAVQIGPNISSLEDSFANRGPTIIIFSEVSELAEASLKFRRPLEDNLDWQTKRIYLEGPGLPRWLSVGEDTKQKNIWFVNQKDLQCESASCVAAHIVLLSRQFLNYGTCNLKVQGS